MEITQGGAAVNLGFIVFTQEKAPGEPACPGSGSDPLAPNPPVLHRQGKEDIPKKWQGREEAPAAPRRHLLPLRRPNAKSILHTLKWLIRKGSCSGEVNGEAQPS